MKILVAHPGTQSAPRIALELFRLDALRAYHTGIAFSDGSLATRLLRFLPNAGRRRIANRYIPDLPREKLQLHPWPELAALWRLRRGQRPQNVMHVRNKAFQELIADEDILAADAVLGFDTSSWLLAQRCQRLDITFALNLTTPHPDSKKKALHRLSLEFPDWADKIEPPLPFVRAAEQQEYELADIIHVACSFTKQTLVENGVSESKVWLNTYGVDCETFHERNFQKNGPIRFVYVGAVNGNKGAPLLFQAWERLSSTGAELWIIGRVSERVARLIPNLKGLRLLGAIPHREIPGLLRQCDVFVFPSYFEGFGLVLLEAMASGLAVITTTATAGPDLIERGRGGWIIPPGDVGGLVSIMESCIADPELVRNAGKDARRIAERHSWKNYAARLIANIGETVVRKRQ